MAKSGDAVSLARAIIADFRKWQAAWDAHGLDNSLPKPPNADVLAEEIAAKHLDHLKPKEH